MGEGGGSIPAIGDYKRKAWPLAIGLSAAYILSRGIAKSGARRGQERDFGRYESNS